MLGNLVYCRHLDIMGKKSIKLSDGTTYLELLEYVHLDGKVNVLVRISRRSDDSITSLDFELPFQEVHLLHRYFDDFMRDHKQLIEDYTKKQANKIRKLKDLYHDCEAIGSFSIEEVTELQKLDIPFLSLLALELKMPVDELNTFLRSHRLPFLLLKRILERNYLGNSS